MHLPTHTYTHTHTLHYTLGGLEERLAKARAELEERAAVQFEKQKEGIFESLIEGLDEEDRGELSDNVWLKREVRGEG